MAKLDELVEAYFREKEEEIKIDSISTLLEYVKEVESELLTEQEERSPVKASKAKDFVLSLPKMVPTEAWGNPNNATRQEMDKFFRAIGGGGTVAGKIKYIQDLQKVSSKIRSPQRIIATLVLLESLSAAINSFGSSSAGFVFEGFLAGLLGGRQVTEKTASGNLPIADIVAFTEFSRTTDMPMSLKVLRKGNSTEIEGSYTNLIDALNDDPAMRYLVAYKEGSGDTAETLQFEQFDITRENILDLLKANAPNRRLIKIPGMSEEQSIKQLEALQSWDQLYPALQQTAGYTKKVKPKAEEPKTELNESKGGTGWKTTYAQLRKNPQAFNLQSLGTLDISPEKLEQTAEKYMDVLQGTIADLFMAVSQLSKNINTYFVDKDRSMAIQKGNEAIKNADDIENALVQVTKQDTKN